MRAHKNLALALAISGFVVVGIAAAASAASTTGRAPTKHEAGAYQNDPNLSAIKKSLGLPRAGGAQPATCPTVFATTALGTPLEIDSQDPAMRGYLIISRAQVIDSAHDYLVV